MNGVRVKHMLSILFRIISGYIYGFWDQDCQIKSDSPIITDGYHGQGNNKSLKWPILNRQDEPQIQDWRYISINGYHFNEFITLFKWAKSRIMSVCLRVRGTIQRRIFVERRILQFQRFRDLCLYFGLGTWIMCYSLGWSIDWHKK